MEYLCIDFEKTTDDSLSMTHFYAHLQEIVRRSFNLKLNLDVIPSLSK
jgi:hypothetical protein